MNALTTRSFGAPVTNAPPEKAVEPALGRFFGPMRARSLPRAQRRLALWLPLTPLAALILLPALALLLLARLDRRRRRPLATAAAVRALAQVVFSLSGTQVEIETRRTLLCLHVI